MTTDIFAQGDKTRAVREKRAAYAASPKCACGKPAMGGGTLCYQCALATQAADDRVIETRHAKDAIAQALVDALSRSVDVDYAQARRIVDAIDAFVDVKLEQSK